MSTGSEKIAVRTHQDLGRLLDWMKKIHALIVRDVRSRFSGDPLGYGWAFLTPLVWIGTIAIVFNLIGRTLPIHTDVISFLIAGMLPYTVFRLTITSTMRSIRAHKYMVYFAEINKRDILLACALLEFINATIVYSALLLANYLIIGTIEVDDPATVLVGFTMAWALGASFGHMASQFSEISESTIRIVPIILRPMFWISGIFFVANELPISILNYLKYNPLLQSIEIVRSGTYESYSSNVIDILIPLSFIVGLNVVAIMAKVYQEGRGR